MKLKIISIWSPKGGVGKSTIAIMLAACLSRHGKVTVCDMDKQGSVLELKSLAKKYFPFKVLSGLPKASPDADFCIIDYAPGYSKIPGKGYVIVPSKPNIIDYLSTQRSLQALKNGQYDKVIQIINMVDMRLKQDQSYCIKAKTSDPDLHIIKNRSIYSRVLGQFRTIYSDDIQNFYGVNDAKTEIESLSTKILK